MLSDNQHITGLVCLCCLVYKSLFVHRVRKAWDDAGSAAVKWGVDSRLLRTVFLFVVELGTVCGTRGS